MPLAEPTRLSSQWVRKGVGCKVRAEAPGVLLKSSVRECISVILKLHVLDTSVLGKPLASIFPNDVSVHEVPHYLNDFVDLPDKLIGRVTLSEKKWWSK